MAYIPLPSKPASGAPWLTLGDAWYANVAQLVVDIPALRADINATTATANTLATTKAPVNNPTFTGTVSGITAAHVGLGDVDNTADVGKTFDATQVTTGVFSPSRLPVGVAGIRQRTTSDEQTPTAGNWQPRPAGYPLVVAVGAPPAPSDAQSGDLHVSLGSASTAPEVGTTFTLPDGSPWPAPWTISKLPTGAVAQVTGNEGRLTTAATTGNYADTDALAARHQVQAANVDILFSIRLVASGVTPRFVVRSNNANLDPQNGVVIAMAGASITIAQVSNWTYTTIGTGAKGWTTGVDYRVRVSAQGTTVRVKQWLTSGTEPVGWDAIGTTSITATGHYGFWVAPGSAIGAYTAAFDDIVVTAS